MKQTLTLLFLALAHFFCYSQKKIWGVLGTGKNGNGLIYTINDDGTAFTEAAVFPAFASIPQDRLCFGTNGYLYGITSDGGELSEGVIYRMKKDGSEYTELHSFDSRYAQGGLLEHNGYLYGCVGEGGDQNYGYIYKILLDGSGYTVIHEFTGESGSTPSGNLIKALDGHLYGYNLYGSSLSQPLAFRIDKDSDEVTYLIYPGVPRENAPLVQDSEGNFYIATFDEIYQYYSMGTHTLRETAAQEEGTVLNGSLLISPAGKLYGSFESGGEFGSGGIFEINRDGSEYRVIHSFDEANGSHPRGPMVLLGDFLYGTTIVGGENDHGTFFRIKTDGTEFSVLQHLSEETGYLLVLTKDENDAIFYTAPTGGLSSGLVGWYDPSTGELKTLKDFNPPMAGPENLLLHTNGSLYGQFWRGGKYGSGGIFSLNRETLQLDTVRCFGPGFRQEGSRLIENQYGEILGITATGTPPDLDDYKSYVFRLNLSSNKLDTVLSLQNQGIRELWEMESGEVYGSKYAMPGHTSYPLFSIDSTLTEFNDSPSMEVANTASWLPLQRGGKLLYYGYDNLYPQTDELFEYDPETQAKHRLFLFDSSIPMSGYSPLIKPQFINSNTLIGVTSAGGQNHTGVIFEFNLSTETYTKLFDFSSGTPPTGELLRVSDKVFYGIAEDAATKGVLYRYTLGAGFTVIRDFDGLHEKYANPVLTYADNMPKIKILPLTTIDFGSVPVGSSLSESLKIRNYGSGNLTVDRIDLPEGFSSLEASFELLPGESQRLPVTFAPVEEKSYVGVMTIQSNAEQFNNIIPVKGLGHIAIVISTERSLGKGLSVYPNPANGYLIIRADLNSMRILNGIGQNMNIHWFRDPEGNVMVNTQSLAEGIYYLEILMSEGTVTRKILIAR